MPNNVQDKNQSQNATQIIKALLESSPYLKGAHKKAQEQGASDFEQAAQQEGGMAANDNLLKQLLQLTQKVEVPGTKIGGFKAFNRMMAGQGFNPNAPETIKLEPTEAMSLMRMQREAEDRPMIQAKNAIDMSKGFIDIVKGITDIENSGVDTATKQAGMQKAVLEAKKMAAEWAKNTGDAQTYKQITGQDLPSDAIQTDITGQPTEQGIKQKERATMEGRGEISPTTKATQQSASFEDTLSNSLGLFGDLTMEGKTGPARGRLAGGMAAIGKGDPRRSELQSAMQGMTFQIGQYFDQTGKALSDKDREMLKEIGNITVDDKVSKVIGTFQNIVHLYNRNQKDKKKWLPNAKQLIYDATARRKGAVGYDDVKKQYVDAKGGVVDMSKLNISKLLGEK